MNKSRMAFLVFLVAFGLLAQTAFAQSSEEIEKTRKEIDSAWTEYLNSLKSFSGKRKRHISDSDGDTRDSAAEFVLSPPYILSTTVHDVSDGNSVKTSSLYNPRYYALVEENGVNVNLKWVVKIEYSDRLQKESWFDHKDDITQYTSDLMTNNGVLGNMGKPLRLLPFWIPGLIKDDRIVIDKIEYSQEDGRRIAVVTSKSNTPVKVGPVHDILEFNLTLMPEHYWLPLRAECRALEFGEPFQDACENEYDFDQFSIPVLTRQTRRVDGDETCDEVTVYTDIKENITVDPKDFTLARWGLPEPEFGGSSEKLIRILLIALGSALILTALFRRCRNRRQTLLSDKQTLKEP